MNFRVLLSLGGLMALVMLPASGATNLTGEYTFTTSSDPYGILVLNNNTTSGSYGIQANSYAAHGSGVYGYSDVASGAVGYGLAGISQTGYGVYGSSYGAGISAIYAENLGTGGGIGMQGTSAYGTGINGVGAQNGVVGETSTTSSGATYAGVFGIDNSSASATAYGVEGLTARNTGVTGFASGDGYGVYSASTSGDSLAASAGAGGGYAILGAHTGEGAELFGYSGDAADPALSVEETTTGTDLIGTYGAYNGNTHSYPETFIVQAGTANDSGNALAGGSDVQVSGDLYVQGNVYSTCTDFPETTSADCSNGRITAQPSSRGTKLRTYASEQSMRTVEDFGEAQLIDGHSFVPLEPIFASSIARDRSYLVFITAEGDSPGHLYVAGKSATGFTVRESSHGVSTLPFEYRIVAHPYGDSSQRMAAIVMRPATARIPAARLDGRALKARAALVRPASRGYQVTRPPHVWVKNLHRS
jgi:hypothetical protein